MKKILNMGKALKREKERRRRQVRRKERTNKKADVHKRRAKPSICTCEIGAWTRGPESPKGLLTSGEAGCLLGCPKAEP